MRFRELLNKILEYAREGGSSAEVHQFLDYLCEQVLSWIENPPKNTAFALEVIQAIKSYYFNQANSTHIPLVKAKIYYLHGVIHAVGLLGTTQNTKQAIVSFTDAARFGQKEAHQELGNIFLDYAFSNPPEDLSKNIWFKKAIVEYQKAGQCALNELAKAYFCIYQQQVLFGQFPRAILYLNRLHDLALNNQSAVSVSLETVGKHLEMVDKLHRAINDALRVTVRFLECEKLVAQDMESEFLKVQAFMSDQNNPVLDYYHFNILQKQCNLLKGSADKETTDGIQQRISALKEKIVRGTAYAPVMQPLIYFVYGLGLFERSLEKELRGKSAIFYFELADKNGCYLAFSYLANLYQDLGNLDIALAYYTKGNNANDPRCLISYFHRCLQGQLKRALGTKDPEEIVKFCEAILEIINLTLKNPFLLQENRSYFEDNLRELTAIRRQHSDYPEELSEEKWRSINDERVTELKNAIVDYTKLEEANYKKRIYFLRKIECLLRNILPRFSKDEPIHQLLTALHLKLKFAIEYINRQHVKANIITLINSTEQQREEAKKGYESVDGHMGSSYYLEHIDPYHRQSSWLSFEWKNSNWRDQPFADFLKHAEDLAVDVPRAIYLDKYQSEQLEVVGAADFSVNYRESREQPNDGNFLYVVDKKRERCCIADDKKEMDARRQRYFYHSSFFCGKPIKGAGEITIKNRHVIHISNGSGHYAPTARQLADTIAILQKKSLVNVADPEFTISLFGVKKVPGKALNMAKLSYAEFTENLAAIILEESQHRDMSAFTALVPDLHFLKPQTDPQEIKEFRDETLISAMNLFVSAKRLVLAKHQELITKQYSITVFSGWFDSCKVTYNQKEFLVPSSVARQLQIMDEAIASHNWLPAATALNLFQQPLPVSNTAPLNH